MRSALLSLLIAGCLLNGMVLGDEDMTTDKDCTDCKTTTEEASDKKYDCRKGDPSVHVATTCDEGCFGLLEDGEASFGCISDLGFEDAGFKGVTECDDDNKAGRCNDAGEGDDKIESCIRCCLTEDCNEAFEEKCDYIPNDASCKPETTTAGAGAAVISASLLAVTLFLTKFH